MTYQFINFDELPDEYSTPQNFTREIRVKYKKNIDEMTMTLCAKFMEAATDDQIKIAKTLYPYFFTKADTDASLDLVKEVGKKIKNIIDDLDDIALVEFESCLERLKLETIKRASTQC